MNRNVWIVAVAVLVTLTCTRQDCLAVCVAGDVAPPSRVTDLVAAAVSSNGMIVGFTQPSDASGVAVYDVRYRTVPLTALNWATATQVTGVPSPTASGTATMFSVDNLTPNTKYYIGIKAQDGCGRWSGLSNIITPTTLLAPPPQMPGVLYWDYDYVNQLLISGFRVRYGSRSNTDPAFAGYEYTIEVAPESRSVTTVLQSGTTYYFVVTAYGDSGESPYSNEVVIQ